MSYRPVGQPTGLGEGLNPQPPEVYSLVDRHSSVEGTFTSSRDLRIEGEMRGTLRCQGLLYVAEGADVDANVEAANIAVAGQLRGMVVCRGKLQIMPTGRVFATVLTQSLVINEGAIYEGELQMEAGGQLTAAPAAGSREPDEPPQPLLRRFPGDTDAPAPQPRSRRQAEE
jgi:cytoskeletal protein CcmA (bactofilin family)